MSPTREFEGGCHCGRVRFRVRTALGRVTRCNCSICRRKGSLHQRVDPEDFTLLAGREALSEYRFGTRTATHYFCRECGIHPFARPRISPRSFVVNLRCLDAFDAIESGLRAELFDGRDWEEAAARVRRQGTPP